MLSGDNSADYRQIIAESFEVLIDPKPRNAKAVIGLKVNPRNERAFILPMEYPAAKELAEYLLRTVIAAAPELFAKHAR
jgi:hypothetical protein